MFEIFDSGGVRLSQVSVAKVALVVVALVVVVVVLAVVLVRLLEFHLKKCHYLSEGVKMGETTITCVSYYILLDEMDGLLECKLSPC